MIQFEPKVTLGELVQIGVTVVTIAAGAWFAYLKNHPLFLRFHTAGGSNRTITIAPGSPVELSLRLHTRARRRCGFIQVELFQRDPINLAWRRADRAQIRFLGGLVFPTNGSRTGLSIAEDPDKLIGFTGTVECDKGEMAVIQIKVEAPGPWSGVLRIESGAEGETTRRATIRLSVTGG